MTRQIWADVTQQKLNEVRDQIIVLKCKELEIKTQCNHTFSDGKSALEDWTDNDPYGPRGPTSGTICTICNTET